MTDATKEQRIADLRARLALLADVQGMSPQNFGKADIAFLLSCLEEARKDSERLDWMDAGDNNDGIMLADPERYSPPHTRFMWSCWPQPPRYFATLREAIDAARTAHPSPSAVESPAISQSGEPLTNDT